MTASDKCTNQIKNVLLCGQWSFAARTTIGRIAKIVACGVIWAISISQILWLGLHLPMSVHIYAPFSSRTEHKDRLKAKMQTAKLVVLLRLEAHSFPCRNVHLAGKEGRTLY